jgi:hypothetical protein
MLKVFLQQLIDNEKLKVLKLFFVLEDKPTKAKSL